MAERTPYLLVGLPNAAAVMRPSALQIDFDLASVMKDAVARGFIYGYAGVLEHCIPLPMVVAVSKVWADGNILYMARTGDERVPNLQARPPSNSGQHPQALAS